MSSNARRRGPRIDLRRPAVLRNSDGPNSEIIVLDVSAGGFRIQFSDPVKVGEFLTVTFEGDDVVHAQVRWVLGNEAGASFVTRSESEAARQTFSASAGDSRLCRGGPSGVQALVDILLYLAPHQMGVDIEIAFAHQARPDLGNGAAFGRDLERSLDDVHVMHRVSLAVSRRSVCNLG